MNDRLDVASEYWASLLRHPTLGILTDVDGTLLPFKSRPEDVVAPPELIALVEEVACTEGISLALVSGRDFFGLKGIVEALLSRLHAEGALDARPAAPPPLTPGRAAELRLGDLHLGYLGEVDPAWLETFVMPTGLEISSRPDPVTSRPNPAPIAFVTSHVRSKASPTASGGE